MIAYGLYARAARREAFEAQYPVIASAQDAAVLESEAARWSVGESRLLVTLAAFRTPSLDSLVGAGEYRNFPPYDNLIKYGAVVEWRAKP